MGGPTCGRGRTNPPESRAAASTAGALRGVVDLEPRHGLRQVAGLMTQVLGRGGAFLDERGIVLRHLVELLDSRADLADAALLRRVGLADLRDQSGHALELRDDLP